jgi:hypothetical protein
MPLFLFFNTQTMHIKSKTHNSIARFFLKPYTLAEFEPGSAVSEAAAMSTAPGQVARFIYMSRVHTVCTAVTVQVRNFGRQNVEIQKVYLRMRNHYLP